MKDKSEYMRSYVTEAPHNFVVVAAVSENVAFVLLDQSGYEDVRAIVAYALYVPPAAGSSIALENKVAVRLVNPDKGVFSGMSDHCWDLWVYNCDGRFLLVRPRED